MLTLAIALANPPPQLVGGSQIPRPTVAPDEPVELLLSLQNPSKQPGGPPSPLIVHYRWTPTGGSPVEESVNIQSDQSPQFRIGPYLFESTGQEYDQWMDLRVFP